MQSFLWKYLIAASIGCVILLICVILFAMSRSKRKGEALAVSDVSPNWLILSAAFWGIAVPTVIHGALKEKKERKRRK